MTKFLRVGACQTPEIIGDIEAALRCIRSFVDERAKDEKIDLFLFPECFLQGYLVEQTHLERYALALDSPTMTTILAQLATIEATLVFGLIEQKNDRYFNTAVVIRKGIIIGAYRKTHLTAGESLFDAGNAYPVFDLEGVKFGINICYDTQFADAAAAIRVQGAHLLLVPAQNMMKKASAEKWKLRHNPMRAERAKETGMWLISADVTGMRGTLRVGYGPTAAINPSGEVVAQVPLLEVGMIVVDVLLP
ncbi:carbon-nitrogen hydrolase family protein [Spirosoma sp. HMF4905]|uniref:Carbon-nitrogen hydrolase family protein n=1 Tax=Spirosoma arboris TaxID=2682092 RepID=A0A7K1SD36_9BACT|nr:carbon-nitrogen hydrolase family protein [Spirosoma arboris]MVM31476.1 carbon-nitrogen hydrolase family protein [Spirosoma arboris]